MEIINTLISIFAGILIGYSLGLMDKNRIKKQMLVEK